MIEEIIVVEMVKWCKVVRSSEVFVKCKEEVKDVVGGIVVVSNLVVNFRKNKGCLFWLV